MKHNIINLASAPRIVHPDVGNHRGALRRNERVDGYTWGTDIEFQDSDIRPRASNAAKDGNTLDLFLYDEIGPWYWGLLSADWVVNALDEAGDVDAINLHVNSPGGDVFEAIAMYNVLVQHDVPVNVSIDGLAASSAATVSMAGDSIAISEAAMMMIHDPWTIAIGESSDLREIADSLDKTKSLIVGVYSARSGQSEDTVDKLMADTTEMTGKEAVELGFATSLIPNKKKSQNKTEHSVNNGPKASTLLARFRNRNRLDVVPVGN